MRTLRSLFILPLTIALLATGGSTTQASPLSNLTKGLNSISPGFSIVNYGYTISMSDIRFPSGYGHIGEDSELPPEEDEEDNSSPTDLTGYTKAHGLITSYTTDGMTVSSSSFYSWYHPYFAFEGDKNINGGWYVYDYMIPGGHWLQLDFGVSKRIRALSYIPIYVRTDEYGVKSWILYGSHDGVTFTELTSGTHDNSSTEAIHKFSNSVSYRYYRFNITETYDHNGWGLGLTELEYYER